MAQMFALLNFGNELRNSTALHGLLPLLRIIVTTYFFRYFYRPGLAKNPTFPLNQFFFLGPSVVGEPRGMDLPAHAATRPTANAAEQMLKEPSAHDRTDLSHRSMHSSPSTTLIGEPEDM